MLPTAATLVALFVAAALYLFRIENPRFSIFNQSPTGQLFRRTAWSSPGSQPDWVAKRVEPLTSDMRQEVAWMENLQK